MKLAYKTTAGIRTSQFTTAMLFLTQVLNLEMIDHEQDKEYARFRLPSGQILEMFGAKNLWHPFTTPPDWEVILADIRRTETKADQ